MSANERPTPETDAFYRHRENLERVAIVEAGTIAVEWGKCAEHARRLERQRDALAEALVDVLADITTDAEQWAEGSSVYRARAALAALERGDGKEGYLPSTDEERVFAEALRQSVQVVDAKEGP